LQDQRHSLNAFATYRLKPTINLSGKVLYGSGFPAGSSFVQSNPERLGDYVSVDTRADKCWPFTRWKVTLYGEVLNLTDHNNRIVTSTVFTSTGQTVVTTQRAPPITPTAGLVFEF
jgi:hypothetical protein